MCGSLTKICCVQNSKEDKDAAAGETKEHICFCRLQNEGVAVTNRTIKKKNSNELGDTYVSNRFSRTVSTVIICLYVSICVC